MNDPRVIAALGVLEHVNQEHRIAVVISQEKTPCCLCGSLGAKMNKHHHGYGPFCKKHASGWGLNLSKLLHPTKDEVQLAFAMFLVKRLKDELHNRDV